LIPAGISTRNFKGAMRAYRVCMETSVRIPAPDGKATYGVFREVTGAPIVVIAHGMTGHMNGRLEVNFARRLEREGYSSLRFNAYGHEDDARDLCDTGLSEHVGDLGRVIEWAAERSDSVIALGHSFGGMCVLLRGTELIRGGVLWDPPLQKFWAPNMRKWAEYDEARDEYVYRSCVATIYPSRMLKEVEAADSDTAAAAFDAPLLVVSSPEFEHIFEAGRDYAERAPKSERVVLEGADHNFTADEHEETLFATTLTWLGKVAPVSG
jgi:uncharacterized protein